MRRQVAKQRPGDRKQQIIESAAYLFSQRGYTATTMRELATHVGMEASSIYNHFPSKQAVLRHICFEVGSSFDKQLQAIMDDPGLTAVGRLRACIEAHIFQLATSQYTCAVANEEWRHLDQPFLQDYQAMRHRYEHRLTSLIEEALDENARIRLSPRAILLTILSAAGWIQHSHNTAKQVSAELLSTEITEWLMRGLFDHPHDAIS